MFNFFRRKIWGEKINECLLTDDEARHALEFNDFFTSEPEFHWWTKGDNWKGGRRPPEGFRYTSDKNDTWLTKEKLQSILKNL